MGVPHGALPSVALVCLLIPARWSLAVFVDGYRRTRCVVYIGWSHYTSEQLEMLERSAESIRANSKRSLRLALYNFGDVKASHAKRIVASGIEIVNLPAFPNAVDALLGMSNFGKIFNGYPHASKLLAIHNAALECEEALMLDFDTLAARQVDILWTFFPDFDVVAVGEPMSPQFQDQWLSFRDEWKSAKSKLDIAAQAATVGDVSAKMILDFVERSPNYIDEKKVQRVKNETCRNLGVSHKPVAITLQNSIVRFNRRALQYFGNRRIMCLYYHTMLQFIAGLETPGDGMRIDPQTAGKALSRLHSATWKPAGVNSNPFKSYPSTKAYIVDAVTMWSFFACSGLHVKLFPLTIAHNQCHLLQDSCVITPVLCHTQSQHWNLVQQLVLACDGKMPALTDLLSCEASLSNSNSSDCADAPAVVPMTEAEHSDYKIGALPLLSNMGVKKTQFLLNDQSLEVLGDWRFNSSLLQDLNRRLVKGGFFLIDNFLASGVADNVYKEMRQLVADGYLKIKSTAVPFNKSGIDASAYFAAKSPAELCKLLKKTSFSFSHHDLDDDSLTPELAMRAPQVATVSAMFRSRKWAEAMNFLLTGSGRRVRDLRASRVNSASVFREWMVGDYSLLHNDAGHERVVSVNYWLAHKNWRQEWGGNFLWCGNLMGAGMSDAVRLPPKWNQAMIFLPHTLTVHSVDVVRDTKGNHDRRFSLTAWLKVAGIDASKHHLALFQRQMGAQMASLQGPHNEL